MPKIAKNLKTLEEFHKTEPPKFAGEIKLPSLEDGDVVAQIGKLLGVIYYSDREGSPSIYVHGVNGNFIDGNKAILKTIEQEASKPNAKINATVDLFVAPDNKTFMFQSNFTPRGIVE